MNKLFLCLIVFFVIADGILIWKYVSFTNTTSKTTAPETTTLKTPSNITQYPINQDVAEKIKKTGLAPLYQVKKDDPECRSIVYNGRKMFDRQKTVSGVVTSVDRIKNAEEYYIQIRELESNKETQFRFNPLNTAVIVDIYTINDNNFDNYQILSYKKGAQLMNNNSLVIKDDVIEVSYRTNEKSKPNNIIFEKDENNFLIAGNIIVKRCHSL